MIFGHNDDLKRTIKLIIALDSIIDVAKWYNNEIIGKSKLSLDSLDIYDGKLVNKRIQCG